MTLLHAFLAVLALGFIPALAQDAFSAGAALGSSPAETPPAPTTFSARLEPTRTPDWVFGALEPGFAGRQISTRLLLWSIPWAGAGIVGLWASNDDAQKGFWGMSGAWGAINATIALVGLLTPEPALGDLKTILLVNGGLDVLYILGGVYLLTRPEAMWRGSGVAVIVQGGFLLVFDLLHAFLIP
jgi:hypothetical protein